MRNSEPGFEKPAALIVIGILVFIILGAVIGSFRPPPEDRTTGGGTGSWIRTDFPPVPTSNVRGGAVQEDDGKELCDELYDDCDEDED